ncbi:MAG: hypothetical protein IKY18_01050 [Oscillospiraceae bacterium]|nr:hypothetical protein [Oscillospiraceae bacterium]
MKKKTVVYVVWAVWYLICLFLSLGKPPVGWAKAPFVLVGLLFFVPPFYLLYISKKDAKTIKLVRTISIVSIATFVVLYALNLMSVNWSVTAGRVLYYLMVVFCAPIMCGQFFAVSLYLWGCLLWACVLMLRKLNRPDQM